MLAAVSSRVGFSTSHTRGCSLPVIVERLLEIVFPAYAGVFPISFICCVTLSGVPRIRGGVPNRAT
ncbi:MAG: hypothetical protein FWG83_03465 [Oscillospiraceae bacterium]|nr:hypothetical protein [Oscillospiraceae bacterium]